jgi:subtilisin family serine protease
MACPQVAGVAALLLQKYPTTTPEYAKYLLQTNATGDIYQTNTSGTDYSNTRSLLNSPQYVLYSAFQTTTLAAPIYTVEPDLVLGGTNISFGGAGLSFV